MSSLMRRQPYQGAVSLQQAMNRLFEDSFVTPTIDQQDLNLAMDMYETDDKVVVKLAVSGVKPEDIQVTVVGDTLSIKGEVKAETETKERSYHLRERRYGSFVRTVTLPSPVNVDATRAEFENGILTLTAPKREEVKPKSIQVKPTAVKSEEEPNKEPAATQAHS